jgi:dUTPase
MRSREDVNFILTKEWAETQRGIGGFGHTGKK